MLLHLANGRIHVLVGEDWKKRPEDSSSMIGRPNVTGYKIVIEIALRGRRTSATTLL